MENKCSLPKRKPTRLKYFDYSQAGSYFVTICVKDKMQLLSKIIVGDGVLDVPKNILSDYGKTADKYIRNMNDFYENINIDKFVIMPNHIHLLISISDTDMHGGTSRTPSPTNLKKHTPSRANSTISMFVSTFKRFCNKDYGTNIWQRSFHEHVIRGDKDYRKIWEYIDTNIDNWHKDCFFVKDTKQI